MNTRKIGSLVLGMAIIGVCGQLQAAIVVGAMTSKFANDIDTLTLSVSITSTPATARTLVVPFAWSALSSLDVQSVTYNGVPLTTTGANSSTADGTELSLTRIYYLPQVSVGTHDLVIKLNGSATTLYCGALDLYTSDGRTSIVSNSNAYGATSLYLPADFISTTTRRDANSVSVDAVINSLAILSFVPDNSQQKWGFGSGLHSAFTAGETYNTVDLTRATSGWVANTTSGYMAQSTAEFVAVPEPGMIFTAIIASGSALMLRTRKPMAKNRMARAGSLLRV